LKGNPLTPSNALSHPFTPSHTINRFNKHIKNLCRNPECPEVHLSNSVSQDVAARFLTLAEMGSGYDVSKEPLHCCILSVQTSGYDMTEQHLGDLRYLGCDVDCLSVTYFAVAYIMGVHFRAGQWGSSRCGSVVTTVADGRSLYARVRMFVRVDRGENPGYALVDWFSEPEYPTGTPLVVRVKDDGSAIDSVRGSVIRITSIDPSRVIVEPDGDHFYMMRDSGYDTVPVL